jgi:BON domain-containing protein
MRRLILSWAVMGLAMLPAAAALGSDQDVAQQIASNLKNSGRMKGYSINVKVQEGIVQLDGTVRSPQQIEEALAIAEVTPGIERVINNLEVKAARPAAPRQAANVAKNSSRRNPAVRSAIRQAAAEMPEVHNDLLAPHEFGGSPRDASSVSQHMSAMTQRIAPDMEIDAAPPRPMAQIAARPMPLASIPSPSPEMSARLARANRGADSVPAAGYCPPGAPCNVDGGAAGMGGGAMAGGMGGPMPAYGGAMPVGTSAARFDQPYMPNYAWPSYAAYPNYAALTYPKQYSPTAWPFIGPFYPYPQVPLGWRKVTLEWDNGWWMLDFKDSH